MTNNNQDRKAPRTVTPWRLSTEKPKREQELTRNEKYDPSEFLFPSYDSDGRSVSIRVRVPMTLKYAMDGVIESRKFPFVIKDDLALWCFYKGLETLESMEPTCVSVMPLLKIMVLVFRAEDRLKGFQQFFAELGAVLVKLTQSPSQLRSARRLARAIQEAALCMPSGDDRSWFLQGLRQRWGHLLTAPTNQSPLTGTDGRHG